MGDRLKDYGFMNPFRSHTQGSNYDASNAYLSGNGINQWLTDVSTYNKILTDFGIQSQIEYKQPNGSWGPTPPANSQTPTLTYIDASAPGMNATQARYELGAPQKNNSLQGKPNGTAVTTMPEYRWKMTGDVDGANAALRAAGLQGSYTGPRGDKFNTGAYIPTVVDGKKVSAVNPVNGIGMQAGRAAGTFFINSGDPLGAGLDGAMDAMGRQSGGAAPTFRYSPISPVNNKSYWASTHDIAKEFFSDPNVAPLRTDPTRLNQVLSATPQIRDTIGTYINDTASYWRSRDDGGGALGVIAKGLSGVAQFASMASGLHGLMAGLGGLASGAGLSGAFDLAMNAAGGMPDIGSVVGGAVGGGPAVGNLVNIGVGGIVGGEAGGLPGAAVGAGGALIGAGVDQAGGVGEFLQNPIDSILGAVGLGGTGGLTAAQITAMEQAAQVGPGSLAQNTSGGYISPTGEYIPLEGGYAILPGGAGQIPEIGITGPNTGVGTAVGAGASSTGSSVGGLLGGVTGGAIDAIFGGGGTDYGNIGSINPGAGITGGGATSTTGPTTTSGGQTGQQPVPTEEEVTGTPGGGLAELIGGGSGAFGIPAGGVTGSVNPNVVPGMQSAWDAFYGDTQFGTEVDPSQKKFGIDDALTAGLLGGPWDFSGTPTGTIPTGGPGDGIGALTTGPGGTGPGGTGPGGTGPGGDGLGGDGTGGDGLGGDGLGGDLTGGFPNFGLLSGMSPGGMGNILDLLQSQDVGAKKKAGQSFYSPVKSPKRRKGITLRRA